VSRLPQQPEERIDRTKIVRFTFDGKSVEAYEGDTSVLSRTWRAEIPRDLV